MSETAFTGFPSRVEVTPIPNLFFTAVMPRIGGVAELKTVLHIFWLLSRRRGYPQFVTCAELLADPILMGGIDTLGESKEEVLREALRQTVEHSIMLHIRIDREGQPEDAYFINNEAGRDAVSKIEQGKIPQMVLSSKKGEVVDVKPLPNIFSLYEQNIGLLTPMISEQIQEAERLYPPDWIVSALKEAVALNKRKWKYILGILERWATEGKDDGKSGRYSEKESDRQKYIRGKYGHMVKG